MRYDTKTDCGFRIDTPLDPREWGFFITVLKPVARDEPRREYRYHLGQQIGRPLGSVNGYSDSEVYYCTWELSDQQWDVLLSGNLTSRTDPFAPLMKCLAFLEAKHGGKE